MVAHVILIIVFAIFFIHSELDEFEDEIQVELIPAPIRLIEPPKTKPKLEIPQEEPPQQRNITSEKEVTVVQPKPSVDIAQLRVNTSTGVEIQPLSPKILDIDAPALSETPDLATDADLPTSPEAVLSPIGAPDGVPEHGSQTKRSHTGTRSPQKGVGEGIRKAVRETGASTGVGSDTGGSRTATTGDGAATFSSIIGDLTDDIIASSGGRPIDVVFVVDASGSMQDNINAVAEHLGQMVDAYKASEIDYQLGLTHFNAIGVSQRISENRIRVFELTQDLSKIQTPSL